MSAVCESNQLVKSFVSSFSLSLSFSPFLSPFSSGPWFFEGPCPICRERPRRVLYVDVCRHNGSPVFSPHPPLSFRETPPHPRTLRSGWRRLDHTRSPSPCKERVAAPSVRDLLASSCQVVCSRYYVRVRNGFIICTVNHYQ